ANDFRLREPAAPALLADLLLVVELVVPEGDHVGPDLVEDLEDVPLVPEDRAVHGLQGADHLHAVRLRRDRRVLEPLRRGVARDHDYELVPELPRLLQEGDVPGGQRIEDACRRYPDSAGHASMA